MAKLAMVRSTRLQSLNRTYPLNLKGNMCILGAFALNPSSGTKKQKQAATLAPLAIAAGPDNNTTYFGTLTGVPTGNGTLMFNFKGGVFRSAFNSSPQIVMAIEYQQRLSSRLPNSFRGIPMHS